MEQINPYVDLYADTTSSRASSKNWRNVPSKAGGVVRLTLIVG